MGYGFKHGGGGATGKPLGTLAVTAPIGAIATISKDGKTYSKVVDAYGVAIFKGLTTGEWAVTIDNGSQTSTQYVMVTLDYAITMAFFTATISVTYPIGSTCTCSDGITTFTAADMSGNCVFTVPNAGTWTVEITDGVSTVNSVVNITSDGQSESVRLAFFSATISVTYPAGSTCTCSDGSTTLTAPDTSGSYVFIVRNTGSWTVTATNEEKSTSRVVVITSDGQSESVALLYETYLYIAGDTCDDITGGYVAEGLKASASGNTAHTPSVTYGESSMVIKPITATSGNYRGGIVRTVYKIDCSKYSKLIFDGTVEGLGSGYSSSKVCIWSDMGTTQNDNLVVSGKLANGSNPVIVDLSGLDDGSYYIGLGFNSTNVQITVTMNSLRLE